MKNPFNCGKEIGENLIDEGYLEATSLNSIQQHQEDAADFARSHFPEENEEDQATVAAGMMHAWGQHIRE